MPKNSSSWGLADGERGYTTNIPLPSRVLLHVLAGWLLIVNSCSLCVWSVGSEPQNITETIRVEIMTCLMLRVDLQATGATSLLTYT